MEPELAPAAILHGYLLTEVCLTVGYRSKSLAKPVCMAAWGRQSQSGRHTGRLLLDLEKTQKVWSV